MPFIFKVSYTKFTNWLTEFKVKRKQGLHYLDCFSCPFVTSCSLGDTFSVKLRLKLPWSAVNIFMTFIRCIQITDYISKGTVALSFLISTIFHSKTEGFVRSVKCQYVGVSKLVSFIAELCDIYRQIFSLLQLLDVISNVSPCFISHTCYHTSTFCMFKTFMVTVSLFKLHHDLNITSVFNNNFNISP